VGYLPCFPTVLRARRRPRRFAGTADKYAGCYSHKSAQTSHDVQMLIEIHDKYCDVLDQLIERFFDEYSLSEESQTKLKLRYIAIHAANINPKNINIPMPSSGIVIAGFGEKEYFPRCRSFYVSGVISQKTIQFRNEPDPFDDIGTNVTAAIRPFAQFDEVATFITGISPYLSSYMQRAFREIFGEGGGLPKKLYDEVTSRIELQDDKQQELKESFQRICQGAFDEAIELLQRESWKQHSEPVLQATGFLNKDELARMAETLINLESFRKQVALDDETVGGPIDVAVITKGDGLIWIKRKHYFRPELNHHFFRNYFNNHTYNELEGERHGNNVSRE